MVQAYVGQKLVKCDISQVFTMSDLEIFKVIIGVIGHGIGGKYIPIMARLAEARRWSKR